MLSIWAFGTSPHGLGLTKEALWALTPREFEELKAVWKSARDHSSALVAALQATLHNAHFRGEHDAVYLPSDFMGETDWSVRQKQARKDRLHAQAQLARMNAKLAGMKPGQSPPGDLPEWAKPN